jgi:histidine triad (HIT) family protein
MTIRISLRKFCAERFPATKFSKTNGASPFTTFAPVHVLVIPKGHYVGWDDFTATARDAEIAGFARAVGEVARQLGLTSGYRLMVNMGHDGHQEVPHLHVHVFGGRQFRLMIAD